MLVQQCQALPARHRIAIIGSNAFHLSPMGSLLVARVAQDHSLVVESVQVAFLSSVSGHTYSSSLATTGSSTTTRVP
jgi:hypothetical protein